MMDHEPKYCIHWSAIDNMELVPSATQHHSAGASSKYAANGGVVRASQGEGIG